MARWGHSHRRRTPTPLGDPFISTSYQNHPFVDANKRLGHAATVALLPLNGRRIEARVDEREPNFLELTSGVIDRAGLQGWIERHEIPA